MDPLSILSVVGSLSSIISLVLQSLKEHETVSPDEAVEIVAISREQGRVLAESATDEFLSLLKSPIFDALGNKIKNIEEEVAKKIQDDGLSRGEVQTLIDQAKADVCAVLKQMKSVNGGVLPPEWADKWVDFQCA